MTDVLDELSVEAMLEARERASNTAIAGNRIAADQIAIYDPEYEQLVYGEDSEIKFGPRGGFEPNVWVGPRNHPLVPQMLKSHPRMFEIGAKNKVYVCDHCSEEFGTLPELQGHKASHGGEIKN